MATVPRLWEAVQAGFEDVLKTFPPSRQRLLRAALANSGSAARDPDRAQPAAGADGHRPLGWRQSRKPGCAGLCTPSRPR